MSGRALTSQLVTSLGGALLHPPLFYNATLGARSFGPLLDRLRGVITRAHAPTVAVICNCGPDEIAEILEIPEIPEIHEVHEICWPRRPQMVPQRRHRRLTDSTPNSAAAASRRLRRCG